MHKQPTPLLGGLAIYGGLVAGLLVADRLSYLRQAFPSARTIHGLLLAGGLLVLVGIVDDRWGLGAISKLAGQIAAGGILVWSGAYLPWIPLPGSETLLLEPDLSYTLTILLVVITINAVNFIDGLDGLAAGVVGISALAYLIYSYTLTNSVGIPSQSVPAVASAVLAACLHRVPAAQLPPGADLHGRHRGHAARPAARLRADLEHRLARPEHPGQLLAPAPGRPVPDHPAAAAAGRDPDSSRTPTCCSR